MFFICHVLRGLSVNKVTINCLKRWNHRKLTLMGKITVVKTFALPKLIYPLTVLDNPSEEIIPTIKTSILNLYGTQNQIKLIDQGLCKTIKTVDLD